MSSVNVAKVSAEEKDDFQDELQKVHSMAKDEFYPDNHVEKVLEDSKISRRNVSFYGLMGFQSFKRYNLHFLSDNVIIFAVGNKFQTYNLQTAEYQTFHGHDNDGVGSIAVHPTKQFFAVAEKGQQPIIYIYTYPAQRLYRILKGGTEMSYTHCEFSPQGDKLVSVGGEPDFTITVWDWMEQRVTLKSKAFSAEVFRCSFSPYADNIIFTSGSTHIKFWKMANTFTGLKLQGEIGKFGKLELSDVAAFYELPDGKVVSGTDQGTMILWDGVQVKAHLVLDAQHKTPLHNGAIEVILFENGEFITAGTDGYIKWWSLSQIDNAEADEVAEVEIQPLREISIKSEDGTLAVIQNMVKGKDFWLVQDARGHLWRLGCADFEAHIVMNFHSGAITDMAVSDCVNMAVSCAQDGTIKLWDYARQQPIYERKFNGRAECLDLLRRSDVNKGRVAAVGYESGIVRVVYFAEDTIELGVVFKAADAPIVRIKYAPSQQMLVTASKTGEIFFFECNGHADLSLYSPLCMIQLPDKCSVTDLKWDTTSTKILVSGDNGKVYEIQKPVPSQINNRETYLVENYPIKQWRIKMMEFQMAKNQKKDEAEEERKRRMRLRGELPPEEQQEDEDWDPECITAVCYLNNNSGKFFCSSVGKFSGYYYLCSFDQERPLEAYPYPKDTKVSYLQFSNFGDLLLLGLANGEVRIVNIDHPLNFLSVKQHDGHVGAITCAKLSFDERFLLSSGAEGLIFIHLIDKFMILQESRFYPRDTIDGIEFMPEAQQKDLTVQAIKNFQDENQPNIPEVDVQVDGMDLSILATMLRIPKGVPDIMDESIYSIQQAKLRTEEDHRLKLAEEKKQHVRNQVKSLRLQFKQLKEKNENSQEVLRVSPEEFDIDPEYFQSLLEQNHQKIKETKNEVQWNINYHKRKLDKLKEKFYDVLDYEKFMVKALKTTSYVTSFRCAQMSKFITDNIRLFKEMLEREIELKEQNDHPDYDGMLEDRTDANKAKERQRAAFNQGQKKAEQVFKTEADKKRAERKLDREKRKAEIDALTQQEHLNTGEDKEEIEKIQLARKTFGEYKLKRSDDYEVPEDQQVNHMRKRQQMILLESSIHNIKVKFNDRVHELRKRKVVIIENVDALYSRLAEINKELALPDETVKFFIDDKVENPAKMYTVDDEQIEAYREKLKKTAEEAANNKKGKGKNRKPADAEKEQKEAEEAKKKMEESKHAKEGPAVEMRDHMRQVAARPDTKVQENDLYSEIRMIRQIELEYEKTKIKEEIDLTVNQFDGEIHEMQFEKFRLESDLKNAELKLILLYEELILLESLESRDQELTSKLQSSKGEKGFIIREITAITRQLEEKKDKIDEIQMKENDLKRRFHDLCPEGSDKYAELSAFYEKLHIRRKKPEKKKEENQEEDEDEEEEAEIEEDQEEEEEDDDQGIAGLNPEDYKIDDIENLRNERLDLWDEKNSIQTEIERLQKSQKTMAKKENEIENSLKETMDEIKDFQLEKLKKLNELEMAVVLDIQKIQNLQDSQKRFKLWSDRRQQKLDQLKAEAEEVIDDEREHIDQEINRMLSEPDYRGFYLPKNLNHSVLFTIPQLKQLLNRQRELEQEYENLQKEQNKSRQTYAKKKKERTEQMKLLQEAERDYDDKRMLRFGNLVDLESLEVSGPSQVVIDLMNKFAKVDARCYKEKEEAEGDLQKTQRELSQKIQENTNLLNYIRELGETLQQQKKKLDDNNQAIFVDEDNEEKRKLQSEREKYKETLRKQAEDINKIKNEINLYKRKGGHIYTKVTTNRKVASLNDN